MTKEKTLSRTKTLSAIKELGPALNEKDQNGNNYFEYYLHSHLYAQANEAANHGANITRTLHQELTKEIEEYLELDMMNVFRYQIAINILYYKVMDQQDFPPHLLKYIDDNTDYRARQPIITEPCVKDYKQDFIDDMQWVKNQAGTLADYLIQTAKEKANLPHDNLAAISNREKLFEPGNGIAQFEELANNSTNTAQELFIKAYSEINHHFNELVLRENSMLTKAKLAHFTQDISIYRGMGITDLNYIDGWFKYGFEPFPWLNGLANRGWMETYDHWVCRHCGDNDNEPNFKGMGFTVGGVYSATNARQTERFYQGAYRHGNNQIVVEYKISKNDLHVAPDTYETAIHTLSYKPAQIAAVYLIDKNNDIAQTIRNPYINQEVELQYPLDKTQTDPSDASHFENIEYLQHGRYYQHHANMSNEHKGESSYIQMLSNFISSIVDYFSPSYTYRELVNQFDDSVAQEMIRYHSEHNAFSEIESAGQVLHDEL